MKKAKKEIQTTCQRCGDCCRAGGPALHSADLPLIQEGRIPLEHLLTVRCGELVDKPDGVKPVAVELVKISGEGQSWSCRYFSEEKGCTIYSFRPQACRVLKCWDPVEILALMEKDTLDRRAVLGDGHEMLPFIEEHERVCSCDFFSDLGSLSVKEKAEVEARVHLDLRFRNRLAGGRGMSLGLEMFFFGRPLFQLLQTSGVGIVQQGQTVSLRW
jgi:Fe-S-cluster containining protein